MCLSFDYQAAYQHAHALASVEAAAAGVSALRAAHDDVDCSKVQKTMLRHIDGSFSVLCYMPLTSATAVLAMYPCPRECLGQDGECLVPCDTIPCQASNLEAWFDPGSYVPIPDYEEVPVYRSLSMSHSATNGGQAEVPVIELPPSKCVKNLDGTCTFVLKTAEYVKTEEEIAEAISTGDYLDKATYLLTLGKAAFKSLVESMDANGVDKTKIFAMSEHDEKEVDPLAMINFLHEFYPNLRPANDMLVCVPGSDSDGNLNMNESAFSFCFHYPDARRVQPLLGLAHNVDHSSLSSEQKVEGDYFITSNVKLPMVVNNNDTGVDTAIVLCGAREFLPVTDHLHDDDSPYRSLRPRKNYSAWVSGCEALQRKVQATYWASIAELCTKMGLPDFEQDDFFSTNIVGRFFPKDATAVVCGKDSRELTGSDVVRRMKASRKAKSDAMSDTKRQASSPPSVHGAGSMDVDAITSLPAFSAHVLSKIPPQFVDMTLTLCRGMDPAYVDPSASGIDRIKIDRMTQTHREDLIRFVRSINYFGAALTVTM